MRHSSIRFVVTAAILVALWYVFSGRLDLLHFGTGVVAAIVIALTFRWWEDGVRVRPLRFALYVPWLIGQIIQSNLRVARLVLSRRMPVAPTFIAQPPGVRGERALATLGTSITLTPGTLTVEIADGEMLVHALDVASARDIRENVIARRVARVFEVAE